MAAAGFEGETLVPGMLTGFRSWRVMNITTRATLRSVSYEYDWVPGVNDATCMADKNARRKTCTNPEHSKSNYAEGERIFHDAKECFGYGPCSGVEGTCHCGFYAYTSDSESWYSSGLDALYAGIPQLWRAYGHNSSGVAQCHGIIDGYGRCVVGPKGFRSSHAIIRALVLPIEMPYLIDQDPAEVERVRDDAGAQLANDHPFARIYPTVEAMRADNPLSTHSLIEGTTQP